MITLTAKQLTEQLERERSKMIDFAIWFNENIYYCIPEENLYYFSDQECYTKEELFDMYENDRLGFDNWIKQ
jgi:hypothetical protein